MGFLYIKTCINYTFSTFLALYYKHIFAIKMTLLSETGKNNWPLIGWALIDPVDDLSVSRKQDVQSPKSRSRPHLEVRKIDEPETSCWNCFGQGSETSRLHRATVIDTVAFWKQSTPKSHKSGDGWHTRGILGVVLHNCLKNHCLWVFSLCLFLFLVL